MKKHAHVLLLLAAALFAVHSFQRYQAGGMSAAMGPLFLGLFWFFIGLGILRRNRTSQ